MTVAWCPLADFIGYDLQKKLSLIIFFFNDFVTRRAVNFYDTPLRAIGSTIEVVVQEYDEQKQKGSGIRVRVCPGIVKNKNLNEVV